MRLIRSKDTKPERAVRSLLHRAGYRFRLHAARLPGTPDLVFPSRRKVIFVHGCFWHWHRCQTSTRRPKTNTGYWGPKIEANRERDRRIRRRLSAAGWKVLTIWECEIRAERRVLAKVVKFLGPSRNAS